jgi:hypothetical protein
LRPMLRQIADVIRIQIDKFGSIPHMIFVCEGVRRCGFPLKHFRIFHWISEKKTYWNVF